MKWRDTFLTGVRHLVNGLFLIGEGLSRISLAPFTPPPSRRKRVADEILNKSVREALDEDQRRLREDWKRVFGRDTFDTLDIDPSVFEEKRKKK